MDHYTKYPVVLVHGLAAKDFSFCRAFGIIANHLRKHDIVTYVTNQDGVGTIRNNAQQLKAEIEAICQAEGCEKVNIIAHSKGGLDARCMISEFGMASNVASLTTLSTPHHGSKLCANVLRFPNWIMKPLCFFVDRIFRLFGDQSPNIRSVAEELTDSAMERFNACVPNHPAVYYQSYSSQASKANAFLVYIPYQISRYCEQDETDGLVSVTSSQWGNYKGQMQGNLNHLQMIALYGRKKRRQQVADFYQHIITQLRDMGF